MMKENYFNQQQLDILKACWEDKKVITIEGVNGWGQPFVTKGRITTTDKGEPGIYEDCLYIEFGRTKDAPGRKQTTYFAPFDLEAEKEKYFIKQLIIKRIIVNGVEIYKPLNEYVIDGATFVNKVRLKDDFVSEKDVSDPVSKALFHMIGKPIHLDGDSYVLVGIDKHGLQVRKGPMLGGVHVRKNSYVYTEANDGKIITLASNENGYYNKRYFATVGKKPSFKKHEDEGRENN